MLEELKTRIAAGEFNGKRWPRLAPGQAVRITTGPMQGIEGVGRSATETRAEVLIELLCQQVPVKIAGDELASLP